MIIAAVDIGSHATKLKISEYKHNKFKTLEEIFYPLALGESVKEKGIMINERRDALLDVLIYFKSIMDEYGVDDYMVLATGVFRVASNGKIVADLIRKKTNLEVNIVEESIERYLTYLTLGDTFDNYTTMRKAGMLVVEVGANSSEVMVYNNNKIVRSNEIHLGTLTLSDSIKQVKKDSHNVPEIIADYIFANTENLQKYLLRKKINHFIILGPNIKKLQKLYGDLPHGFSERAFNNLYTKVLKGDRAFKSELEKEMIDYNDILISIMIYAEFKKHTITDCVLVPNITLRDGILRALINQTLNYDRRLLCTCDIIKSAKQLAKRYHSTAAHINQVDKFVVKLFDAYKKQEEFTEKDLLILRLAACLHETGKFARQDDYNHATKMVIINASLLGVTRDMLNEVASVVDYSSALSHGVILQRISDNIDTRRVKMALLLSAADALDKSKRSRLVIKQIRATQSKLKIKVSCQTNYYVEKSEIASLNEAFKGVFAQSVVLEE